MRDRGPNAQVRQSARSKQSPDGRGSYETQQRLCSRSAGSKTAADISCRPVAEGERLTEIHLFKIPPKTGVATDPVASRGIDAPDRRSDAVDDRNALLGGAVRAELQLTLAPVLMDLL